MELFYYSGSLIYLSACPSGPGLYMCLKVLFNKRGFNCISDCSQSNKSCLYIHIGTWYGLIKLRSCCKITLSINCDVHLDAKYMQCSSKLNGGVNLNRNMSRYKIVHMFLWMKPSPYLYTFAEEVNRGVSAFLSILVEHHVSFLPLKPVFSFLSHIKLCMFLKRMLDLRKQSFPLLLYFCT